MVLSRAGRSIRRASIRPHPPTHGAARMSWSVPSFSFSGTRGRGRRARRSLQRRAEAVVQYLASKYNVPAHKFYLIGIGKDQAVADNHTAKGRAQNRRVEVKLLSNMASSATTPSPSGGQ